MRQDYKEGWQIINETPVPLFMRYSQTPQVEPSRQYEPDILDKFLQLVNLKREEDKILLVVYMDNAIYSRNSTRSPAIAR